VNGDLELSASLGWRQGVDGGASTAATMGVAIQYKVDKDLVVRGKVTNTSQVGLAMTHTLKPGNLGVIIDFLHIYPFLQV